MSYDSTSKTSNSPETRRSFLRQAAVASAVIVPGAVLATEASAASGGSLPNLYGGWNSRNFKEIQADENFHVQALQGLIHMLGGVPNAMPTFQGLRMPNMSAFGSQAMMFENTGARAYLSVLPLLFDRTTVIPYAGAIAQVEAYHSGYLNTLLNTNLVPYQSPLVQTIPVSQVVQRISPFIANLNGVLPTIGMVPSPANDLEILNFALILEYLEADFYNINVPAFFG